MTCIRCQHQTCKRFGYFGKRRIQRWRCNSCNSTFCEPVSKLGTHYTAPETAAKALALMLEGMSVRAISRITGLHKGTVLGLMNTAAANVTHLMNAKMRGISARYVQSDEIWCFVGKKRRNVRESDPAEMGDAWVFVAMDAETKLVPSFVIGKRTKETTLRFLRDLQSRLTHSRFQLTTDGFHFYERGVEDLFGGLRTTGKAVRGLWPARARKILPTKNHGGYIQSARRSARSQAHQHQPHRTPEPHDANADASLYAPHERFL